jgi:drug/metabolite transporter (DMT)-like permease
LLPARFGRSLLLTGVAEVWASLRPSPARTERSGLVLMVVSAAAFSAMAAIVKGLLPDAPTQAVVLSRGVLMAAACTALALRLGVPLVGKRPGLLLLRGLLGYGSLSCYFWAVQRLPLGDAVLLQYTHPVFVGLLAPLLLGEPTRRQHWPNVLMALAGVALVVGPSGELRGAALVALVGSLCSGLAYMAVRDLARTEHPLTILISFPVATIPGSLVATLAAGRAAIPHGAVEIGAHLAVFACAMIGQVALTAGLARADAARATAVSMTGPVFALIFGLTLFGTVPRPASLAGTALVLVALWRLARSRAA